MMDHTIYVFSMPIYRENSMQIYFHLLFMIKTEELQGMVRLATRFLGLSEGAQWPANVFSGDGGSWGGRLREVFGRPTFARIKTTRNYV